MTWQKTVKQDMSPKEVFATLAVVLALVTLVVCCVIGSVWQGHGRRPAWLSVQRPPYQPCQHEDGSGLYQTFPCTWDAALRGNHERGVGTPRWLTYARAEEGCPQSRPGETCAYAPEYPTVAVTFDRSCPVAPYDESCRYEPGD